VDFEQGWNDFVQGWSQTAVDPFEATVGDVGAGSIWAAGATVSEVAAPVAIFVAIMWPTPTAGPGLDECAGGVVRLVFAR
jgi:hypothetical protein